MHLLGLTAPRIDTILAPYAEKSYQMYYKEFMDLSTTLCTPLTEEQIRTNADKYAEDKVRFHTGRRAAAVGHGRAGHHRQQRRRAPV